MPRWVHGEVTEQIISMDSNKDAKHLDNTGRLQGKTPIATGFSPMKMSPFSYGHVAQNN